MELPIPFYALVAEQELRRTKKGDRFFWQNSLKTTSGLIKAFMWNAPEDAAESFAFPHEGDIIEVVGFEDQVAERGSVVISPSGFSRITKADVPEDQREILEFEKASDQQMDYALSVLRDDSFWEDSSHYKFVQACLDRFDQGKLMACPAATHVHHSYQGGLMVHTAEVLELCRAVAESSLKQNYNFINRDVLYAGAILHDIGKVETYYINDMGIAKQTGAEKTIGHLFYGMQLAHKVAESNFEDQDPLGLGSWDFVNEVIHLIASHHGQPEFGSIKPCLSVESGILSRIDYISSRNGMVESVLKEAVGSGLPLQNEFKIYGDFYFASMGMRRYIKEGSEMEGTE